MTLLETRLAESKRKRRNENFAILLFAILFLVLISFFTFKLIGFDKEFVKQNAKIEALEKENEELKKQVAETNEYNRNLRNYVKVLETERSMYVTSRQFGFSARAKKAYDDFEITWYCDTGITASGMHTKDEFTFAVDPDVIPLGSRMLIVLPNGEEYYGIAADTGGAVIGNIADIHTAKGYDYAIKRGRVHGAKVYVLS